MIKEIPTNWTDYVLTVHKEQELDNQTLTKFKKYINENVLDFENFDNLAYYIKLYFKKYKNIITKLGISKLTNSNLCEILISTKISQRLFRIKKNSLDSTLNCLEKENKKTLGDSDYFTEFSNQFIFINLKI